MPSDELNAEILRLLEENPDVVASALREGAHQYRGDLPGGIRLDELDALEQLATEVENL